MQTEFVTAQSRLLKHPPLAFATAETYGAKMLITGHSQRGGANSSARPAPTIISADLVVVGNISSPGEIQLEGKVLGDVRSSHLTIGPGGRVEGDVVAERVAVFGEIAGKVSARDMLVTSTGRVDGSLAVENLTLEPGGHFEGHCARAEFGATSFVAEAATGHKPITSALVEAAE